MSNYPERRILLKNEEILQIIKRIAKEVARKFRLSGKNELSLVCVLQSAYPFAKELEKQLEQLNINVYMYYITASSYKLGTTSNGDPTISNCENLKKTIEGTFVCIVEDMIDTGATLAKLEKILTIAGELPCAAVLLEKKCKSLPLSMPKVVGKKTPKAWLDGFGIDSAEENRDLLDIFAVIQSALDLENVSNFRAKIIRERTYDKRQLRERISQPQ
jgi:hypoxanthine phosphoribosyltransferase